MSYAIMFSGPHAIGKSSTGRAVRDTISDSLLFMDSNVGMIATEVGFDLNANPTPKEILEFQKIVLKRNLELYRIVKEYPSIWSRSPLDFLVYTVMGLKGCEDQEVKEQLNEFIAACQRATMENTRVLIIPAANLDEPYEDKPNRPVFNEAQKAYRKEYYDLLCHYASSLGTSVKVLHVPVEYQYKERVEYIMKELSALT